MCAEQVGDQLPLPPWLPLLPLLPFPLPLLFSNWENNMTESSVIYFLPPPTTRLSARQTDAPRQLAILSLMSLQERTLAPSRDEAKRGEATPSVAAAVANEVHANPASVFFDLTWL